MENVEFSWKKLPNATKKIPSIRCNMSGGVYDDHLWLLLGAGAGNGRSSEVWKYSIKNGEWSYVSCTGDAPSPRDGHSATYVGDGKFVVFGGQGEPITNNKSSRIGEQASKTRTLLAREVFNDVYEFDCKEHVWSIVHPLGGPPPTSRRQHSANFISYDDEIQLGTSPEERNAGSTSRSTSYRSVFGTSTNNESRKMKIPNKVPNNSVLIYGGCGIEPSKKSEQVYNDLWSYVVESKTWIPLQSRGHVPRPQSGHKSEVIGDILIIIGGIAATASTLSKSDQAFSDTLCSMTSDVMTLNIRTLTWTYLDTKDALGERKFVLQLTYDFISVNRLCLFCILALVEVQACTHACDIAGLYYVLYTFLHSIPHSHRMHCTASHCTAIPSNQQKSKSNS